MPTDRAVFYVGAEEFVMNVFVLIPDPDIAGYGHEGLCFGVFNDYHILSKALTDKGYIELVNMWAWTHLSSLTEIDKSILNDRPEYGSTFCDANPEACVFVKQTTLNTLSSMEDFV